jgi:hypothetical protein
MPSIKQLQARVDSANRLLAKTDLPKGGTLAARETETVGPGADHPSTEVRGTGRGGPAEGGTR